MMSVFLSLIFANSGFGSSIESSEALDGALWVMVALMFFVLGAFSLWFWQLYRRSQNHKDNEVEELLEDLRDEERRVGERDRIRKLRDSTQLPDAKSERKKEASWEKEANWWKNS